MLSRFGWSTFDVADLLPQGWQQDVLAVAVSADFREFPRTPILTREAAQVDSIHRGRVPAGRVRDQLPWLPDLYHSHLRDLAEAARHEPIQTAEDYRYGVVLNVQRGTDMRFECHVDSNPISGVLFFTDHEAGGELVIANDQSASDMSSIDRDCTVIRPHAGHLIIFPGSKRPHYARPLVKESDVRITAVMNFYTDAVPESTRPPELNRHLFGDT